ncbi:signal peptide-containing protein [Theileria equi strain WA]|uniref:Signal peptide-containing protein n=1 Tax=Theileria equi strain WA TaxID=1537102 RepID=L0AVN4_THEEQ|nr:signal peptide-containing protein [Theileria equi strain WA]AFZ79086.1 signal peptide-containing protein [Theileria equi strain WA]|eukprot:XP_004828752.1 signal peptide-containing protein [Theileria equi strain WA]
MNGSFLPFLCVIIYLWVFVYVLIAGIGVLDKNCKIDKNHILVAHNDYRHFHLAPKLEWSDELEESAIKEAKRISNENSCKLPSYYRKLTATNYLSVRRQTLEERVAVEFWYEGKIDYDFVKCSAKSRNPNLLAFTQLIWKNTTHVGCGVTCCDTDMILVCRYHPFGNIPGEFCSNVEKRYYDTMMEESHNTPTQTLAMPNA